MRNQPLVSMITYCYNGERFVDKYFEAILSQEYSNIELIFFDNGSQDRTREIAESYRTKMEQKGINVNIIHYDENQSTCMLKQQAFQQMQGEYFFGCDSDDFIDPSYISEMVDYLQSHPEKGIVYCQLRRVEEESGKVLGIMKMQPRVENGQAFMDILDGDNINFTAISYMMSRKHFERINPEKKIFISQYGENYQVQMPFLYHDLQGYIEKPLGQYTVRRDSYSGTLDVNKKIRALKGQEEAVLATLEQIKPNELDYYRNFFLRRIRSDRFYSSLLCDDEETVKQCYKELSSVKGLSLKSVIYYWLYKMNLFGLVTRFRKR